MITCMINNPIALLPGEQLIHIAALPVNGGQDCTRCGRQFAGAFYQVGSLVVEMQTDRSTAFVNMIYLM